VATRYRQVLFITHVDDVAEICDPQIAVTALEEGNSVAELRGA
jgi:hypothetical protein